MRFYDYECSECNQIFEHNKGMNDPHPHNCADVGGTCKTEGTLQRTYNSLAIKGSSGSDMGAMEMPSMPAGGGGCASGLCGL